MQRTTRAALVVIAVGSAAAVGLASRRRTTRPPIPEGDRVPAEPQRQRELVDTATEDSFPASDPPSYWGREPQV
jgi:hypothetical protein